MYTDGANIKISSLSGTATYVVRARIVDLTTLFKNRVRTLEGSRRRVTGEVQDGTHHMQAGGCLYFNGLVELFFGMVLCDGL